MRTGFKFFVALEYIVALALMIAVRIVTGAPGESNEAFTGNGTDGMEAPARPDPRLKLSPANAVFLPFLEAAPEVLAAALVPGGRALEVSMLKGWYAGRCNTEFDVNGESLQSEIFELLIEEDGSWICAAVTPSCVMRYRIARGRATIVNGRVLFEAFELDGKPGQRFCSVLPVWWGERLYLLGPGDVARFCNSINRGAEPRRQVWVLSDVAYVRADRTPAPCNGPVAAREGEGLPLLPESVAGWILGSPIEGQLSAVQPDGTWKANVGARQGVFPGMEFRVLHGVSELRVHEIHEDSCVLRSTFKSPPSLPAGTVIRSDARPARIR